MQDYELYYWGLPFLYDCRAQVWFAQMPGAWIWSPL